MTPMQIDQFAMAMDAQGVNVTRTKKGLLLRLPDGSTQMKHFTESDIRGHKNLTAALKRAGITMPGERTADLPAYITSGTISKRSKERIEQYVRDRGFPEIIYYADIRRDLDLDPATVNRHLYHTGFVAEQVINKKRGRPWRTPDYLMEEKALLNENTDQPEATPDVPAPPVVAAPAPAPVSRQTVEREFIDSHRSRVVNLDGIPENVTARDYLRSLASAGLEVEIRVWYSDDVS
jgi:hypothetical protein